MMMTRMARVLAIGGDGAGGRKKERSKKKLLYSTCADSSKAQSKGFVLFAQLPKRNISTSVTIR